MSAEKYKKIASNLKYEGRAFINGKYVEASDGEKFETINPATGEILCSVAKCNKKDVDIAVNSSRVAFESGVWSKSSPEHRKEVLLKFAELLRQTGEENSVLESVDTGKLITDCINEVANDAQTINTLKNDGVTYQRIPSERRKGAKIVSSTGYYWGGIFKPFDK